MTAQEFKETEDYIERIKGLYLKEIDRYIKYCKAALLTCAVLLLIITAKFIFQ